MRVKVRVWVWVNQTVAGPNKNLPKPPKPKQEAPCPEAEHLKRPLLTGCSTLKPRLPCRGSGPQLASWLLWRSSCCDVEVEPERWWNGATCGCPSCISLTCPAYLSPSTSSAPSTSSTPSTPQPLHPPPPLPLHPPPPPPLLRRTSPGPAQLL